MPYKNNFQFVDMRQQNRFIMIVDGLMSWHIRTSDLPNLENNPVVVDTINAEYKIKGKSRWQDISVTLYDPIDISAAKMVHDWIKKHHNSDSNDDGRMSDYKKDITLMYVDPKGAPVEAWKLHGAFFASVNWGSVDVSSDDLLIIEGTISYDWAEIQ